MPKKSTKTVETCDKVKGKKKRKEEKTRNASDLPEDERKLLKDCFDIAEKHKANICFGFKQFTFQYNGFTLKKDGDIVAVFDLIHDKLFMTNPRSRNVGLKEFEEMCITGDVKIQSEEVKV
jgi:hypothetical protein